MQHYDASKIQNVCNPVTGEVVARCRVFRCLHCGGEISPDRLRWEGDEAFCPKAHCDGVGIGCDLIPKDTLWRRDGALMKIKRIQVKCENCCKVWQPDARKGIPLRCDFCGTVGMVERVV
jgi:Zn finger protein HypA/HybF involved in hydrogenase expression